jgi:hypothetical protein
VASAVVKEELIKAGKDTALGAIVSIVAARVQLYMKHYNS